MIKNEIIPGVLLFDDFLENISLASKLNQLVVETCNIKHCFPQDDGHYSTSWISRDQSESCSIYPYKYTSLVYSFYVDFIEKHLSKIIHGQYSGIEWWSNADRTSLGWHVDKDEYIFKHNSIVSLPLTTIIYYPFVDCQGGDLLIHNESIDPSNYTCYNARIAENSIKIKPVSNRLIIFRSGYPHCVRPFQGSRRSLILNPWKKRVNGS